MIGRSRVVFVGVLAFVVFMGGELFARLVLGLGSPPLTVVHPTIEYLFKPHQDVLRFGNRVLINAYGMRSADFDEHKQSQNELRVMVFGDSVINGGAQTDHEDLATTIVSHRLTQKVNLPVVVGNISAGSWGPGNWLAYAREYGFFDADAIILVASSHDVADNPTFAPLNPNTHPVTPPFSAFAEGVTRYLPRYFPKLQSAVEEPANPAVGLGPRQITQGLSDLRGFLKLALVATPKVIVVMWPTQEELHANKPKMGWSRIKNLCQELGVQCVSLWEPMNAALLSEMKPYRDNIHPNQVGQKLIATALLEYLNSNISE